MLDEFYVFLPSNTVTEEFPNNTTSCFSTPLPKQLELPGDNWEVALAEVSYPHTWYNIESTGYWVENYERPYTDAVLPPGGHDPIVTRRQLIPGYYSTGEEIVEVLNEILENFGLEGRFKYYSKTNMITLGLYDRENIKLSGKLAGLLGFTNRNLYNYSNSKSYAVDEFGEMTLVPDARGLEYFNPTIGLDLNLSTHNIFVYTNIVRSSLVGNVYAPLLRTVSTQEKNRGHYVTEQFYTRYYHPLDSHYIKQITIDLRDDQGKNIKFHSGKVSIVLHFRSRNQVQYSESTISSQ